MIKTKLNREQLDGIYLLLGILIRDNPSTDAAEMLVNDHVYELYTKIRKKAESLETPRSGWSLTLTKREGLAFYIFFQNVHIPETTYQYEVLQLTKIFNEADQIYGTIKPKNRGIGGLAAQPPKRTIGSPTR